MAMLHVYTQNGGIVEAADIRIAQKTQARREELSKFAEGFKKYNDYAEKQIQEILGKNMIGVSLKDIPLRRMRTAEN